MRTGLLESGEPIQVTKMHMYLHDNVVYVKPGCLICGAPKGTDIEVSDEIYKLKVVAVSTDGTKIQDPEKAEGPNWYTTDAQSVLCYCCYREC